MMTPHEQERDTLRIQIEEAEARLTTLRLAWDQLPEVKAEHQRIVEQAWTAILAEPTEQPERLEGWALRSDSLKSRAMHYFRAGQSICVKHWPQKRVALHREPQGMTCPACVAALSQNC